MESNIQGTALYREVEAVYRALRQPGTGLISDIADLHASPDSQWVTFSGTLMDSLEGSPPTRICLTEIGTSATRVVTFGPNSDRLPQFSPDGQHIAYLSDRQSGDNYQLYLLDPKTGASRSTARLAGWIEYLQWSPDGTHILLGLAGHGADVAGAQGAITSTQGPINTASWMPTVEGGHERNRWRAVWVYDLATNAAIRVSREGINVWEAAWCGDDAVAAVISNTPDEGEWYESRLAVIQISNGDYRELYRPHDQLGCPSVNPSGDLVAIIEAVCSDRCVVAGDLLIIETASGKVKRIDTQHVDISCAQWRSDDSLLVAGHRGFETVVGLYARKSNQFTVSWSSEEISTAGFYSTVTGIGKEGDCVIAGESFVRAPEIAVIRGGKYTPVKNFDLDRGAHADAIAKVERVTWNSSDGLEIQGYLLLPSADPPYPLIMNVHGGPVGNARPIWVGRRGGAPYLMLVRRGYAVFFPNPRGSGGRGQDFARSVYGDMGGGDAKDLLTGLDALVERGIADRNRLGVTGISYGGFMTAWLVTQDERFAAAVCVAPHTNQVTERLLSNIPQFMDRMMADSYHRPGSAYFERSPIMHAHKVRTPTLNICGALDRCTPPEEAAQFYNALREGGVATALVTYPEEGHGIRKLPAAIDYTARLISWFESHMSPRREHVGT